MKIPTTAAKYWQSRNEELVITTKDIAIATVHINVITQRDSAQEHNYSSPKPEKYQTLPLIRQHHGPFGFGHRTTGNHVWKTNSNNLNCISIFNSGSQSATIIQLG